MKKFKLQSVLDYREVLENQAIQAFSLAQEEETALRSDYDREREKLADQVEEFEVMQSKGIPSSEYLLYQKYIDRLKERVVSLEARVERARIETEERHAALCQASMDKKHLEKFREKHLDSEKRQAEIKERRFLDELALRNIKR